VVEVFVVQLVLVEDQEVVVEEIVEQVEQVIHHQYHPHKEIQEEMDLEEMEVVEVELEKLVTLMDQNMEEMVLQIVLQVHQ
jgi:hypothetical protein